MYINIETQEYPLGREYIQQKFPDTSLPETLSQDTLLTLGFAEVISSPFPAYDPSCQVLVEQSPEYSEGTWKQSWTVLGKSKEELNMFSTLTKTHTKTKIVRQLSELDMKKIRPLAEGDLVFLEKLNKQSSELRNQLKALG